jgi:hypothetical protein
VGLTVYVVSAEAFVLQDVCLTGMAARQPSSHKALRTPTVSITVGGVTQCRGSSIYATTKGMGILRLMAQRQGSTQSVDLARDAKERVQSTVFKVLGGLALSFADGYCIYTGQNPVEVVESIVNADPQQALKDSVEYIESLGTQVTCGRNVWHPKKSVTTLIK